MVATADNVSPLVAESHCYPLTTIAQAKAYYLVNGLGPADIAAKLGVSNETVWNWARSYGWTKARKDLFAAAIGPETVRGAVQAKLEAIALESSDLAQRTLALASDAITDGRTRDVMFAASAVKTFADIASKHSGNDSASATAVNVSFTLEGLYRPEPRNVTPDTPALPAP